MTQPMATLNSKSVMLSQPYCPTLPPDDEVVGRSDEARMVLAAWIARGRFPRFSPFQSFDLRPGTLVASSAHQPGGMGRMRSDLPGSCQRRIFRHCKQQARC